MRFGLREGGGWWMGMMGMEEGGGCVKGKVIVEG